MGDTIVPARNDRDADECADGSVRCDRLRSARDQIAGLDARLAAATKARAELVHLVSHELRTPITVISGFARLLQNEAHGSMNEEQHRFVAECLKACRRLDDFVGDLLEARAEGATPFDVDRVDADLHESIEGCLEALGPMLDERGMKVEASLRAERPCFAFDARRIEQVITNLMTNAIRYGNEAGIVRLATDTRADTVVVSVEDDGPGIPEHDRERLFAPFVRGVGITDSAGLGIGLAICRRIVASHGGSIGVEEAALGGARFVFELPRTPSASAGG